MPDGQNSPERGPNAGVAARLEAALNAQADHAYDRAPVLTALRSSDPHPIDAPVTIAPTPIRATRRRAGVAIGAAVVGVAAVAAATIAFTDVGPSGGHAPIVKAASQPAPSPQVSAAATPTPVTKAEGATLLAAAAAARAATGDPTLRPGQFLLQKTVSSAGGPGESNGRTVQPPAGAYALDRTWRPADQNDIWTRVSQIVGFRALGAQLMRRSGVCDDLYQDTQDPPPGSGCSRPGGFGDISPDFVAALPRDPSALYAQLRTFARGETNPTKVDNVDALIISTIDGLFYSDAVPADLASSLIEALALVPTIHVIRDVTTYNDRVGIGVQVSHVDGVGKNASLTTSGVIFDPKTGAYLGDYSGRPGSKNYGATDVTVSVVDSVPAAH